MSDELYQKAILRLAAEAYGVGHLAGNCCRGHAANTMCGDVVDLEIQLDGAHAISALAHDLQGCVLVQASASLLAQHAAGQTEADIAALNNAVAAMLNGGAAPDGPWRAYEIFKPAMTYRSRHSCVLLPIEALLNALKDCRPDSDAPKKPLASR